MKNLERVADAVHYSRYHLHRMFTTAAGMTLHDYIRRRKLTEAARLLVFSDLPVIQTAPAAGADHPGRRPHRGSTCIFQTNRKYRFLNRSPSVP